MTPNPLLADLDLSVRLQNICYIYNLETFGDLCMYTRQEFAALRHVGRVTLAEVEALLAKHGRRFWQEGEPRPEEDVPLWWRQRRALHGLRHQGFEYAAGLLLHGVATPAQIRALAHNAEDPLRAEFPGQYTDFDAGILEACTVWGRVQP